MEENKSYDQKLEEHTKLNKEYIDKFENWLKEKGLSPKTIRNHVGNVDTYLNYYLNYYEFHDLKDGCYMLNGYLGDFFIRKCMWSTAYSTKQTSASIKKFYQCMNELNYVEDKDYKYLCEDIKENMDYWLEEVEDYNSMDYSDFF